MDKQSKNDTNLSGLPTALLYLALFAVPGCLGAFLFALFTGVFFWGWLRLCDWSVVSVALPSTGARWGLGLLIYLLALVTAYASFRSSQGRVQRESARKRQKETASMQHNEPPHTIQGEAQSPALTAGVQDTQDTSEGALQTGLRFDGMYVADNQDGKINDYTTGALVACQHRYFLRFFPNGLVFLLVQVTPVTAPANPMFTPEKVFDKLGQFALERGHRYTLTGNEVSFRVEKTSYEGTSKGLSLLLCGTHDPDPHGNLGDVTVLLFAFVKTA